MPGKIKVKILAGRNLPVMDRSGDTTDAYVELKFGNITYKTDVCRKSLNPQWNSEWYRFEVDDAELQDEPLQIRLMDHDTYSANDAIGKVYVNLNPLLLHGMLPPVKNIWTLEATVNTNAGSQGSVMTGWIPVYDTMHGIRGEVNIIIKVELFSDFNKFRQSSCGVQFFYSPNIPYGYHAQMIHGFVEELVVSDDPEYKWIDKIRTPRASNEARQTLFFKLSGEVQRKIGLKALDLGGNAVIGYLQNFDLEGESGIVARGIGTAVTLVKLHDVFGFPCDSVNIEEIAFALSSRAKAQMECLEADDNAPLIPTSVPARTLASYPVRIPTRPVDRSRFPFHARSLSSLTRLERAAKSSETAERIGTRRKRSKRIPFFRTKSSSTWSLRTSSNGLNLTPPEHPIDKTVRSLRTMLRTPPEDTARRESPKDRFSKQIKDLRGKFDSVGEERRPVAKTDRVSDVSPGVSSVANTPDSNKQSGSFKRTITGKIMATLLIDSMQNMHLEDIGSADPASAVSSSNERSNDVEARSTRRNKEEDSRDLEENDNPVDGDVKGDVKAEEQQGASSLMDETEMTSSRDDDKFSSGDDSSNGSAGYNILNDSRCSLDEDDTKTENSSSFLEGIPIIRISSAESCTVQIDSDATSSNVASMEDVRPRNDEIPIITVDVHESAESVDALGLPSSDESPSPDVSTSRNSAETDILTSSGPSTRPLIDKSIDASSGKAPTSQRSSLSVEEDSKRRGSSGTTSGSDVDSHRSSREARRVRLARHERDPSRVRAQSARPSSLRSSSVNEMEDSLPTEINCADARSDRTATDIHKLDLLSWRMTGVSYEETIRARAAVERQRCMRDLIELIDTRMMVSTRATSHRRKRTVSVKGRRRKREKTHRATPTTTSGNSLERFPSRGPSSTRRHRRSRRDRDVHSRVPRVRSTPDHLSSDRRDPTLALHAASRSCGSSFANLTDRRHITQRVSPSPQKRAAAAVDAPIVAIDRRRSDALSRLVRGSFEDDKVDTVATVSDASGDARGKAATDHSSSRPTSTVVDATAVDSIRKCSSVCNLGEALCHTDRAKPTNTANMTHNSCVSRPSPDLRQQDETSSVSPSYPLPVVPSATARVSQSPATRTLASVPLHRRSSDSDLSVTPKGNSLGSDRSMAGPLRTPAAVVRPMNQDTLEMLEYPFITMQHYPPGFILHIGGLVSSRSVKLLERISNLEEPEGRDAWWTEIRMEVRSHARALACNVVIGYKEETSICDDVCVLSASGTAAVINFHNSAQDPDGVTLNKFQQSITAAGVDADRERAQPKSTVIKTEKADNDITAPVATHSERQSGRTYRHFSESNDHEGPYGQSQLRCNLCHLPYSENSVPFRVNVSKCAICKRARVPDVMFTTIEVPANIPMTGRGCFIQATVCKNKKDLRGELNAKEISDCLPFLEYELHSLLLNKLKVKGMNAVFGLRLQVSVGERLIIGMAVGTAVYLTALPPPTVPQIASGNSWHNEEQLAEIQKSIVETVKKNREFYHLKPIGANEVENGRIANTSDTDESDEDLPELDLGLGTRDACVLEVDDIEDMDRISSLMDDRPPDDFHVVNTQTIPGLEDLEIVRNLQMFTQVSRAKIPAGQFASMPSKYFARLLQSLYFKLRRMVPCALCDMQFKVALSEQDEIQLTVVGMALGLGEPLKTNKYKRKVVCRSLSKDQVRKSDDSDMIFSLDEDHLENNVASDNAFRTCVVGNSATLNAPVQKPRPRSPLRSKTFTTYRRKHMPLRGRYGVDITPLSYLPGGRIERYQGNLNFFFIRESTSIRENGGLSGFTHSFVMEVLAIVRAHITALGGNAMVAFFMTQCVLLHSPHKNQGQCLINVGGDVVTVSYYADEKHNAVSNC